MRTSITFHRSFAGASLAALMLAALAVSGCVHHHHGSSKTGPWKPVQKHAMKRPPPHAPAHGHRHRHHHDGVVLVFDSGIGVYAVDGQAGIYWDTGHYLRFQNGRWYTSVRFDRGWVAVTHAGVPARLVARHETKHKKKHGWKKAKRGKGHSRPAHHEH